MTGTSRLPGTSPSATNSLLRALRAGDPVIKYGARIGTATQDIVPGEHVHPHNMRSDFDERASTLDAETALPEDVVYELY